MVHSTRRLSDEDIYKNRILLLEQLEEVKLKKKRIADYYSDVIVQLGCKFSQDEVYHLHFKKTINKIEARNDAYIRNLNREHDAIQKLIYEIDETEERSMYNEY